MRKISYEISGPSIKSAMEGKEMPGGKEPVDEQHELLNPVNGEEPVTEQNLSEKWVQFTETLSDRPSLKSSLERIPVLLPGGKLVLTLDNLLQEELIREIKPRLVNWLRRELNNSSIDLVTQVIHEPTRKVAYTDSEKFDEMVGKNANLALMKQKFNLDFDT